MRWLAVSTVVLVLAGCSVPGEPVDVPAPPAVRALVVWSDTMCDKVKSVDGLRKQIDPVDEHLRAMHYLDRITDSVDDLVRELKDVPPTRVAAADGYIGGLVKTLESLRQRLPAPNDPAVRKLPADQVLAKARQVAAMVAEVAPQAPALAGVAGASPELDTSYDLAPRCTPVGPEPSTRAFVMWTDSMCGNAKAVENLPSAMPDVSPGELFGGIELSTFISSGRSRLGSIAEQAAGLKPTGVKAADEYRERMLTALKTASAKMPEHKNSLDAFNTPAEVLKPQAGQVVEVFGTVRPVAAGLDAAVKTDAGLNAAYDLAPRCTPIGAPAPPPLPTARNGTDLTSCASGTCQVQVSGRAEISTDERVFVVTVDSGGVSVSSGTGVTQMQSVGGAASFGRAGGKTVRFRVLGLTSTAAVLDVTTN
ncbi:hypothetical protein NLX83_26990 [Allokutzneria sp. A3M-2-11 16]|uniref:hypothetical protein n=1 Tax=Allokutzneria sp. A3M-2-11 16 TaxID=2962043 RepID=UPI0020B6F343|nr:hypothetical protein [Allokutzneria sp. A3M-2-11 16]MCP3802927.1 hypothetical protein [Allokutzneria sp. A3M-2-11 16]